MHARFVALSLIAAVPLLWACWPGTAAPRQAATPAFKYDRKKEGGCADLYLYKMSEDSKEVLWIRADRKKLKFPDKGSLTFDLAKTPEGLQVAVDLWAKAPSNRAYCNDIAPDTKREATWKATKGKVTITVTGAAGQPGKGMQQYKASAKLEGVVFEDNAGNQATLREETITDQNVGWYPG